MENLKQALQELTNNLPGTELIQSVYDLQLSNYRYNDGVHEEDFDALTGALDALEKAMETIKTINKKL